MTAGWRRWRRIWQHTPEGDVDAELQFHLDERIGELIAAGADADHARAQALREFGDLPRVRDGLVDIDARITRRAGWIEQLASLRDDLRYVARSLRRSPGFVVAVVLTLALGLGANAAVFSFLDQLFLRPPAGVAHPSEIRRVYRNVPRRPAEQQYGAPVAGPPVVPMFDYPEIRAIRAVLPASAHLATYSIGNAKVGRGGDAPQVSEAYVDGDYFSLLGVRPLAGRFFTAGELRPETPVAEAVISARVWQSRFGGSAALIGHTMDLDNHPFVVIGIAGNDFLGPDRDPVDVWVPMNTTDGFAPATPRWYDVVFSFRITALVWAPTADTAQLLAQRATIGFRAGPMAEDSTSTASLGPLVEAAQPGSDQSSVAIATRLAGVALIILLIAAANVTNLLLARTMRRRREIAVRLALGVSRARLVRLLLSESFALAAIAVAAALASAWWTGGVLRKTLLPGVHWAVSPIDLRVIAFIVSLMVVAGGVIGLVPAMHSTRTGATDALKAGAREGGFQRSAARTALLVIQAALCLVLLSGAGVFVRSLHSVETTDIGFDTHQLVAASVAWDPDDGDRGAEMIAGIPSLIERVRRLPGVERVGTVSSPLMSGFAFAYLFLPNGDSVRSLDGSAASPDWVSPDYFAAAGMHLMQGRGLRSDDRLGSAPVMVVNQTMARRVWPGRSAVGQCLIVTQRTGACREVVGVVNDAHMMRIIEPAKPQFYIPAAQDTTRPAARLVIRAAPGRAVAVAAAVRGAIRSQYGDWAIPRVHTLDETLAPQLRPWRLGAELFSAAGLLALLVAMVGIYSTISYTLSQRTHEIGVRVALGARGSRIVRMVVAQGVRVVAVGVVIGLGLAWTSGRLIASMLYQTSPHDPLVLVSVSVALLVVAALACAVPAWRASRVDPVIALRAE